MASNSKKAGAVAKGKPTESKGVRRAKLAMHTPKSPTSPPDSGLAPELAPAPLNGYVSPGGAGRVDELRRTSLYREAFMYRRVSLCHPLVWLPSAPPPLSDSPRPLPQQHRVRLSGIDAPEKWQAFGQVSKQHLSDLAYDKTGWVVFHKRNRHKRILGKVLVNGAMRASIESNRAWPGITRSTSASNPLRTGWPTLAPRRRLGQSGAVLARSPAGAAVGVPQALKRCAAEVCHLASDREPNTSSAELRAARHS